MTEYLSVRLHILQENENEEKQKIYQKTLKKRILLRLSTTNHNGNTYHLAQFFSEKGGKF